MENTCDGVHVCTAQKIKFSIKDFFNKCEPMRSFMWIWSHLMKKSWTENWIFYAVLAAFSFHSLTIFTEQLGREGSLTENDKVSLGGGGSKKFNFASNLHFE